MKCPLATAACIIRRSDLDEVTDECLKEECAWWDDEMGDCAVLDLAQTLWSIRGMLADIRDKIPHEEQFRK